MKIQLDHINMYVKDINDSVKWYEKVFDFQVVESGKTQRGYPFSILRNGDSMLCLSQPENSHLKAEGYTRYQMNHFALRINDPTDWEARMDRYQIPEKFGGKTRYPFSTSWYVQDPTGHEIEVVHWQNERPRFPESP